MSIYSIIIYIIWFLSEFILNRMLRSKSVDVKGKDKDSLRLLWLTIIISMTAAGFFAGLTFFPVSFNINIIYFGLGLIIIGIILRFLVIKSLGKFFTVDVAIRQNHELKTTGIYKILRHPSYACSLISFIGAGLSINNWVSLALSTIPVIIAFSFRIKVEEQALTEYFGEKYSNYKKHTAALIPYIY